MKYVMGFISILMMGCGQPRVEFSHYIPGPTGPAAQPCTVVQTSTGATMTCPDGTTANLNNGSNGATGPQGPAGSNSFSPGLSCDVHNLPSWDGSTTLPQALVGNPLVGNFTLPNFSVPDSQASLGFPGMPANLQSIVGVEGYILDCAGYINVPTSGVYTFRLLSDDGSILVINNSSVVQNQGLHAPSSVTNTVTLYKGANHLNIVYYQGPLTQIALQLNWSGPNLADQIVPSSAFSH